MNIPIFKLLNQSPDIVALLKNDGILRAYEFGLAPQNPTYPYLVWQFTNGDPYNHIDEPPLDDHLEVQIDIYTKSADQLKLIRKAARRALEHNCIVTGFPQGNSQDPETNIYRTGFICNWIAEV